MRITIGFTKSRHDIYPRYVPAVDGYRPGAEQDEITFDVPSRHLVNPNPRDIAESVFVACGVGDENGDHIDPDARAVYDALAACGKRLPRLVAVGDTVAGPGWRLACDRVGWRSV